MSFTLFDSNSFSCLDLTWICCNLMYFLYFRTVLTVPSFQVCLKLALIKCTRVINGHFGTSKKCSCQKNMVGVLDAEGQRGTCIESPYLLKSSNIPSRPKYTYILKCSYGHFKIKSKYPHHLLNPNTHTFSRCGTQAKCVHGSLA